MTCPVLASYQRRLSSSVTDPELDDEIAGQILWLDLAALFPPEPEQGILIIAHDDPGVRAADKVARKCGFKRIYPSLPLRLQACKLAG